MKIHFPAVLISIVILLLILGLPHSRVWNNGSSISFGGVFPNQLYGNVLYYSGDIETGYDVYLTFGNMDAVENGQEFIVYSGSKYLDKVRVYRVWGLAGGVWAKSVGNSANTSGRNITLMCSASNTL